MEISERDALISVTEALDHRLGRFDVLLDNQATASAFREPELLCNIKRGDHAIRFDGIGGSIISDKVGDTLHFGTVSYVPDARASVLCLADAEESYQVSYQPGVSMIVHYKDGTEHVFKRRDKLYVSDFSRVDCAGQLQ